LTACGINHSNFLVVLDYSLSTNMHLLGAQVSVPQDTSPLPQVQSLQPSPDGKEVPCVNVLPLWLQVAVGG